MRTGPQPISVMEQATIDLTMDERSVRALHSAVAMTLEKWTGQGDVDQESLFMLRTSLQACIFEFDLDR